MNAHEAISAIHEGRPVDCTAAEYHEEIRTVLQDRAGRWIDGGQDPYAWVALEEVKRLDGLHGSGF